MVPYGLNMVCVGSIRKVLICKIRGRDIPLVDIQPQQGHHFPALSLIDQPMANVDWKRFIFAESKFHESLGAFLIRKTELNSHH